MTVTSISSTAKMPAATQATWQMRALRNAGVVVEACWKAFDGCATGDFFEVATRPDGTVAVLLGDAPGWGPGAAERAGRWTAQVRDLLCTNAGPAEVLAQLDTAVQSEGPEVMATAVCVVVHPLTGTVVTSSAGQPPPVLSGTTSGQASGPSGRALGLGAVSPPVGSFRMDQQQSLYLVTDGMIERRGVGIDQGWLELLKAAATLGGRPGCASQLAVALADRLGAPEEDAMVLSIRLTQRPMADHRVEVQAAHVATAGS